MPNPIVNSRSAPQNRQANNGIFQLPGPWIGIVQEPNNPPIVGRLLVYIAEFSGPTVDDPDTWIPVDWVGTFGGFSTSGANQSQNRTYGMTAPQPNKNNRVFCFFVNGDSSQGYWIGVVPDLTSSRNLGTGATPRQTSEQVPNTALTPYITVPTSSGAGLPAVMPCSSVTQQQLGNNFNANPTVKTFPHVYQILELVQQGLLYDGVRGISTSSPTREGSNQIFAINTPGRYLNISNVAQAAQLIASVAPAIKNPSQNASLLNEIMQDFQSDASTGGHQFIMDDGNIAGYNQQIRIRTTNGNEILLDDTYGQIYIVNSRGSAWVELTPSGRLDVFSSNDISMHSQGNINFHADKNINFHANNALNLHGGQKTQLDSGGTLVVRGTNGTTLFDPSSMSIGTNGGLTESFSTAIFSGAQLKLAVGQQYNVPAGMQKVADPIAVPSAAVANVGTSGGNAWWTSGTLESICPRVPTHEPWPNHEIVGINNVVTTQGAPIPPATLATALTPNAHPQGPTSGSTVQRPFNKGLIATQPTPSLVMKCKNGTPLLSQNQLQAFMAAIGQNESGWPQNAPGTNGTTNWSLSGGGKGYYAINAGPAGGDSGKYQFRAPALETLGYIRAGSSKQASTITIFSSGSTYFTGQPAGSASNGGVNATGGQPITNILDFMNNGAAQELIMQELLNFNLNQLLNHGTINCSSTPSDVAGLLWVSQALGAGAAEYYHANGNSLAGGPTGGLPASTAVPEADYFYNRAAMVITTAGD